MKPATLTLIACLCLLIGACASAKEDNEAPPVDTSLTNEQIVLKVLQEGLVERDLDVVETYVAKDYKQHNPYAATGRQGLVDFIKSMRGGGHGTFKNVRIFSDGEYVVTHNEYDLGEKQITFDVFRVVDHQLVEHWDGVKAPAERSVNGHTETDGAAGAVELNKTDENKKLVRKFVDDVLVNGNVSKVAEYLDGENFVQHDPEIADGATAWGNALKHARNFGKQYNYDVRRVLGAGNFVLVQSKGDREGAELAMYDLFRVMNGKIVEHWTIRQKIPENPANENGMVD